MSPVAPLLMPCVALALVAASATSLLLPEAHSPATRPPAGTVRQRAPGAETERSWPLSPRPKVLRPFSQPLTRYAKGHRGVDLAASAGQPVLAVGSGRVTHVGVVAGRGTVTLLHPSGLRSTYEPVDASVRVGQEVSRGDPVGRLAEQGSHCAPASCLHLGALRGTAYVDPLLLLGAVKVRLLPLLDSQAPDGPQAPDG